MLPIVFSNTLDREFDHLLRNVFRTTDGATQPALTAEPIGAALDVYEDDDRFEIWVDVPGLSRDDVKLELDAETLTIKGERPARAASANERHFRSTERWYGSFERKLTLPPVADASRAEAQLKDGVLKLVLPKRESSKPRQIKVS